jgi:Holliday junction resolvase-like predicted endonuclease
MEAGKAVGAGEAGERRALSVLERLSDEYVAITNCKIPGYERIGDLDIIVLGPHGVAVVEVKNLRGRIIIDGEHWSGIGRHGAHRIKSGSKQLRDEVQALSKYLSMQRVPTPVHGFIGINPNAELEIVNAPAYPLVPYDLLADKITDLPAARNIMFDVIERKLCSTATTT